MKPFVFVAAVLLFLGSLTSQVVLAECETTACRCEASWGCEQNSIAELTASASSAYSEATAAALAVDDNDQTSWIAISASMPQSLEVALDAETSVCEIVISFERASRWRYELETSPDQQHWQRVGVENAAANTKTFRHTLERVPVRYLRLNITGSSDGIWAGVAELRVSRCCDTSVNKEPVVVPRLRQWVASTGNFTVSRDSAITLASLEDRDAIEAATTFAADVQKMFGITLPLVYRAPVAGDFSFATSTNISTHDEGYSLDIGDVVSLQSRNGLGLIHGTQTILQILTQAADHRTMPKGLAIDAPSFSWRGLMLDGGRKYWEMDFLRKWIRLLGWYKMNVFHWHLSDSNAFRFGSLVYPGLAPAQHYSIADIDRYDRESRC